MYVHLVDLDLDLDEILVGLPMGIYLCNDYHRTPLAARSIFRPQIDPDFSLSLPSKLMSVVCSAFASSSTEPDLHRNRRRRSDRKGETNQQASPMAITIEYLRQKNASRFSTTLSPIYKRYHDPQSRQSYPQSAITRSKSTMGLFLETRGLGPHPKRRIEKKRHEGFAVGVGVVAAYDAL